ncbi:unnamed protein product [Pleuronectes platessa]|uniref:Uncharacterized protein n=1 Tax=Pleuronectes platessa TaxID=8262 RepID=A0A9N7U4R7_PLEPL|nr:unnamed protein product [Pleuronectes platessa]
MQEGGVVAEAPPNTTTATATNTNHHHHTTTTPAAKEEENRGRGGRDEGRDVNSSWGVAGGCRDEPHDCSSPAKMQSGVELKACRLQPHVLCGFLWRSISLPPLSPPRILQEILEAFDDGDGDDDETIDPKCKPAAIVAM